MQVTTEVNNGTEEVAQVAEQGDEIIIETQVHKSPFEI